MGSGLPMEMYGSGSASMELPLRAKPRALQDLEQGFTNFHGNQQ